MTLRASWRKQRQDFGPIVIAGSATRDIIHRGAETISQIGGTVWYSGLTLANLGFKVRVVTRLAEPDQNIARALREAGLEARVEISSETTVFHNIYGSGGRDDRRQRVLSLAAAIGPEQLLPALENAALCYLGPLHPLDLAPEALAIVKETADLPVVMDVQGFTRRVAGSAVMAEVSDALPGLIERCQIVKASRAEACLIAGEMDVYAAAERLGRAWPQAEMLVTCGADGVYLVNGHDIFRKPALRVDNVDPTGAGDMFLAAYVAARLRDQERMAALGFAVRQAAAMLGNRKRFVTLADPTPSA